MKIKHVSITTDKLSIANNHIKKGNYKLNPLMNRSTGRIDDNRYFTQINLKIDGASEQNFPVNLEVSMRATFTFDNLDPLDDTNAFLKTEGVNILFPYLRAAVTNLSTAAMMPPIILPIMNAAALFKQSEQHTIN